LNASQIQAYEAQELTNIQTALVTVQTAGVFMVLATITDPGRTPAVAAIYTNASQRELVSAVIQNVNNGLRTLAQKYQVPLVDWFGLETVILGPNTNLHSTLLLGNVSINLRASDPGPPASVPTDAFVADSFHPNTTIQGILANSILEAFNLGQGSNVALFSEQEILSHAGIAYGGSDTLQAQIGSYSNYVILPVPLPRISSVRTAGNDFVLTFSTLSNQLYVVQSSGDLSSGVWTTLTNNLPGTGGPVAVTDVGAVLFSNRFYRVRQLP
jgi:hypothetical protein